MYEAFSYALNLQVYEAFSYYSTSVCGLKLLVYEAFSYALNLPYTLVA